MGEAPLTPQERYAAIVRAPGVNPKVVQQRGGCDDRDHRE